MNECLHSHQIHLVPFNPPRLIELSQDKTRILLSGKASVFRQFFSRLSSSRLAELSNPIKRKNTAFVLLPLSSFSKNQSDAAKKAILALHFLR